MLFFLVACSNTSMPAAPPSNVAVAVEANVVTITWQDNSNGETGFAIDRKQGDADFVELVVLQPNATSYTDTTALPGESYVYRVRALGLPTGDAASSESEPVSPEPVALVTLEIFFTEDSRGSGTITSEPEGLNCSLQEGSVCSASFPQGSTVTLTATPDAQSAFASWGEEACESSSPTCQIELTDPKTLSVRFVPSQNTLTVQKAGDGSGRVTSGTPPDIDCGEACVASYEGEVTFRLRATPEVGSSFAGWSDNCTLVNGLCEVKIGNGQGATVTATFTKTPPPVITTFAANTRVVVVGGSVTFSWTVTGEAISSLVLQDNKTNTADIPVTGLTSYTFNNLQETATYTLVATNVSGSTTSQSVSVRVGTAPTLANLFYVPNPDGSFNLNWEATGTTPLTYKLIDTAMNAEMLPAPTASPYTVRPLSFPTTYRLEATNAFGAATPLTITIEPPVPANILGFTADTTLIVFPGTVNVSWSIEGSPPLTLTLTRDDTGEVVFLEGLTGSVPVSITETTNFTLTAQNPYNTATQALEVRVRNP